MDSNLAQGFIYMTGVPGIKPQTLIASSQVQHLITQPYIPHRSQCLYICLKLQQILYKIGKLILLDVYECKEIVKCVAACGTGCMDCAMVESVLTCNECLEDGYAHNTEEAGQPCVGEY
jgi:hypothetical protein